jgi:hypothetical protein
LNESAASKLTQSFVLSKTSNPKVTKTETMRIASSSLSWAELFAVDSRLLDGHVLVCWAMLTVPSTSLKGGWSRHSRYAYHSRREHPECCYGQLSGGDDLSKDLLVQACMTVYAPSVSPFS